MGIDSIQATEKPDKMLQIQSAQKNIISGSIFDDPKRDKDSSSTIHSGHFMVSRVHEDKDDDDDEEAHIFSDDTKDFSTSLGYDFVQAKKETSQTYNFGPKSTSTLSIDASLTKLFECMTLAYSGKITSPKWKPFRGMHLTVKDKVRLNNIIWREWHMQYIFQRRSIVCQFATPLSDYIHTKPEAVVLEGKYWKRRLDTVTKEYKNWRRYYRDRILHTMPDASAILSGRENLSEVELLERVKDVSATPRNMQQSSTDLSLLNSDLMDMDFTDNLFSTLNQPFPFPNPREISQFTCADLIQPGLVQLQPNLEDFMDIDTMQEFLTVSRSPPATSFAGSSGTSSMVADLPTSLDMSQQHLQLSNTTLGLLDPNIFGSSSSSTASINLLTALAALTSNGGSSNNNSNNILSPPATTAASMPLFTPETQMIIDDAAPAKQTFNTAGGGVLGGSFTLEPTQKQGPTALSLQPAASSPQQTFLTQPTVAAAAAQQRLAPQQTIGAQQVIGVAHQTVGSQSLLGSQPGLGLQQALVSPQTGQTLTMQTVNLASLGLTQTQPQPQPQVPSPASSPSRSLPRAATSPTALPTGGAASPSSSAYAPSLSRMVKGQVKVSPRSSPSHTAAGAIRTAAGTVHSPSSGRKDGFAVPQGKPMTVQRKPRTIAPAPAPSPARTTAATSSPSPSMQNTYLAQLLIQGTYPGAIIKKEPVASTAAPITTSNFTPILPAVAPSAPPAPSRTPSTPSLTATPASPAALKLPSEITMEISKAAGVDFPTSVLLAAASSAIGTTPSSLKDALRLSPSNTATASMASATEMSTTPVASPAPRSPMQMSLSNSPAPSATPPPSSPLAAVFSEALSPISSPSSSISMPFHLSPPSAEREEGGLIRMGVHTEQRRVAHLSAEQKRRCSLKSGFDLLHTLVPSLAQNPKVSKATMLQKTAEHCRKMKSERAQMQREAAILKQEIESLNNDISVVQSQLPETGVPVTRQRVDQMKEMFEEYVRNRTLQNWKFWIFSIIIRSLFDSYNNMVSTSNVEELCRTTAAWLDQHCSLVSLRPTVLNALRHLSMSTSILTEPSRVREQATQAVTKGDIKGGKSGIGGGGRS